VVCAYHIILLEGFYSNILNNYSSNKLNPGTRQIIFIGEKLSCLQHKRTLTATSTPTITHSHPFIYSETKWVSSNSRE